MRVGFGPKSPLGAMLLAGLLLSVGDQRAAGETDRELQPQVSFVSVDYLGEQAKPFPLLLLAAEGFVDPRLKTLAAERKSIAREYTLPPVSLARIVGYLRGTYRWRPGPATTRGQDAYEVVLWAATPERTLLTREEMRDSLERMRAITQDAAPEVAAQIEPLVRRLSN